MNVVCVGCGIVGVGAGAPAGESGVVVTAAVLHRSGHVVFTGSNGVGLTALVVKVESVLGNDLSDSQ